jgi:glycosyltransferase involved in cell wall biosynthesis
VSQPKAAEPLRVGIDGRAFSAPLTGISRYIREVCVALDEQLPSAEFVIYSQVPCALPVETDRWRVSLEPASWARRLNSFVWFKTRTLALSRRDRLDVYWANTGFVPRVPAELRVVASVYDLVYRMAPETMRRLSLLQYRAFFDRDLRRADAIVSLSQGTANRLRAILGINVAGVAAPGVSGRFSPPAVGVLSRALRRHGLERPYFFAVGTLEPRKNVGSLIYAFERWRDSDGQPECELVLAGGTGWRDQPLQAQLSGTSANVRLLGRVSDDDLPALYAGAIAFVFPSRYEGFGLPVLEARACGARIIASDTPEIREAGGQAARYVTPTVPLLASALSEAWRERNTQSTVDPSPLPSWKNASAVLAACLQPASP